MRQHWMPRAMRFAPALKTHPRPGTVRRRYALLLNPFYPKDPHASFGKHVLTPSLALTSVAAATPPSWEVRYWDENLLQGAPPSDPLPEVVGISVHLTFASRAFELARWYRDQGTKVILGGLHVISCPDEVRRTPMRWRLATASSCGDRCSRMWRTVVSSQSTEPAFRNPTAKMLRHAATYYRAAVF